MLLNPTAKANAYPKACSLHQHCWEDGSHGYTDPGNQEHHLAPGGSQDQAAEEASQPVRTHLAPVTHFLPSQRGRTVPCVPGAMGRAPWKSIADSPACGTLQKEVTLLTLPLLIPADKSGEELPRNAALKWMIPSTLTLNPSYPPTPRQDLTHSSKCWKSGMRKTPLWDGAIEEPCRLPASDSSCAQPHPEDPPNTPAWPQAPPGNIP